MEARVSDFGLAALMEPDKTRVSTLVAGTFGYVAPEYFDTGRATVKGDKLTDEAFIEEGTTLVTWVKAVVQDKRVEYVLDNNLGSVQWMRINIIFSRVVMCLEPEPSHWPTMAEVVKMLEQIRSDKVVKDT
ncbi:hypothetical protein M0R45_014591 [Rubus argutus]|uniref:Protein kinase domain-containing protein n=1 Tax=Rubus argutus TaxID=59490 RepID=A0AAW1XLV1_RUBAR